MTNNSTHQSQWIDDAVMMYQYQGTAILLPLAQLERALAFSDNFNQSYKTIFGFCLRGLREKVHQ